MNTLWFMICLLSSTLATFPVLPDCCHDFQEYAHIMSGFYCNFSCQLRKRPYESDCISCLKHLQVAKNYSSELLTKPVVICQDVFLKFRNSERKKWGRILLSWSGHKLSAQSLFSVEVKTGNLINWHFLGMTNLTAVPIDNLEFDSEFKFRVTPFVLPDLIYPSHTSEWIYLAGDNAKGTKSLNLTSITFRLSGNFVEAVVEWTMPKEAPCSLLLYWQRVDQHLSSNQKILSLPADSSPVILPDLIFQTDYLMTLSPIYQSDTVKVKSAERRFLAPSCLSLTRNNYTLCAPGPPLNVTATWVNDTVASLFWLPPDYTSFKNDILGYHVTVSEASKRHHTTLRYKENFAVEQNILNVIITDLNQALSYLLEVRATSKGGIGPSIAVELHGKEPVEVMQPVSYVPWHYIVPSSVIAVTAIIVALCINLIRCKRRSNHKGCPSGTADIPEYLLPHLLPITKVNLHSVIGKGEFGEVHMGVYSHCNHKEIVAVKVFPSESISRSWFLHEVKILHVIGRHQNVISLIGFTMDVEKMFLVMEHCGLGNLHSRMCEMKKEISVIKRKLSDPMEPLLNLYKTKGEHYGVKISSYIHQISVGMEYISSLNLIHRDLAARNILLCSDTHVKIADFGLAKMVSEDQTHTLTEQKKLPIRWMAPESLENRTFSMYSDVWSFGVLMWEIFKFGKVPYSPMSHSAILPHLKNGYRLEKPHASSQAWYNLMLECWNLDPLKRPTFKELVMKTEKIISRLSHYTVIMDS